MYRGWSELLIDLFALLGVTIVGLAAGTSAIVIRHVDLVGTFTQRRSLVMSTVTETEFERMIAVDEKPEDIVVKANRMIRRLKGTHEADAREKVVKSLDSYQRAVRVAGFNDSARKRRWQVIAWERETELRKIVGRG